MLLKSLTNYIPRTKLVNDLDREDPVIDFILSEYEELIEEGFSLDPISNDMTFNDLRTNLENLSSTDPERMLEFIQTVDEIKLDKEKDTKNNESSKLKIFIILVLVIFFIFIVLMAFVIGALTGTLSATEIITKVISAITTFINVVFASPTPF